MDIFNPANLATGGIIAVVIVFFKEITEEAAFIMHIGR